MTFKEFFKLREELFATHDWPDNPSNPGNKRKDAKDLYLHKYGSNSGGIAPSTPQKMKKK